MYSALLTLLFGKQEEKPTQSLDCLHSGGIAATSCGVSTSQFAKRRQVRDISSPRAADEDGDRTPAFGGGTPNGTKRQYLAKDKKEKA